MATVIFEARGTDKAALIKYAIENKYEMSFWYRGVKVMNPAYPEYKKQNWRFAQPVALGKGAASGKLMLRAWQKGGVTNTVKPAWKTFLVDEMKNVTVFDGKDGVYYRPFEMPDGPNYNDHGDKKMEDGTPLVKIDLTEPPGPNKGLEPKPNRSVQVKPGIEPTKPGKVFKKRPAKPVSKPVPDPNQDVHVGPKEPIRQPDEKNDIETQIIPTKDGNPNNPKPSPQEPAPDQNPGQQNNEPEAQKPEEEDDTITL